MPHLPFVDTTVKPKTAGEWVHICLSNLGFSLSAIEQGNNGVGEHQFDNGEYKRDLSRIENIQRRKTPVSMWELSVTAQSNVHIKAGLVWVSRSSSGL